MLNSTPHNNRVMCVCVWGGGGGGWVMGGGSQVNGCLVLVFGVVENICIFKQNMLN